LGAARVFSVKPSNGLAAGRRRRGDGRGGSYGRGNTLPHNLLDLLLSQLLLLQLLQGGQLLGSEDGL
jgi:hypothetical protein